LVLSLKKHDPQMNHISFKYLPSLDGLRGVSIMLVLVVHLNAFDLFPFQFLPGGFLGVDLFFVLSGFLITTLLIQEYERSNRISLSRFYVRRALRLLPALSAVLLLSLVVFRLDLDVGLTPLRLSSVAFYFTNWLSTTEPASDLWFLAHCWSLSIEEHFYFLWPPILILLMRSRWTRRRILTTLIVAIVAVNVDRFALLINEASTERLFYGTDTRADAILIGCLLSLTWRWNIVPKTFRHPRTLTFAVGLFAINVLLVNGTVKLLYCGGLTSIALSAAVIVLHSVETPATWLSNTLLVWIGKRSYSLYLWHLPVFHLLKDHLPPAVRIPTAIIAAFIVAALSYQFIEQPFLRLKSRRSVVEGPYPTCNVSVPS